MVKFLTLFVEMVVLICLSAWNKTDSAISFKDDTNNDISLKNETFCKTSLESIGSISECENKTTCEFTNLKKILDPSTRGRLYPLHKSKELVLIKFNDSNLIAIEISSKCLHKLGDVFFRWLSVHDIQNLFDNCTNEVLFRKLFCNPIVTYNISYNEHEIFPYFSNVGLYFTDESNFCTPRFRQFVETNNDLLNNNDIDIFLRNITSCWKYMYFTNQVNIKLPSGSLTSDENHFFKGDIFSSYTSSFELYFASKQEFCVNHFLSNLFFNGSNEIAFGAHYIWYDYITEFTSKTDCLEVNTECRRGSNTVYTIPNRIIAYSLLALASEVMVVNVIALLFFFQKGNISPVTIILSALSVSDIFSAILMSLPTYIAHQHNFHNFDYSETLPSFYIFDYPKCVVYCIALELKYCFHFVSFMLTLLLCLQKTAALLFPLWSNRYFHNKVSVLYCLSLLMVSLALFSPILYFASVIENVNGTCCGFFNYIDTYWYMYMAINMCTCVTCAIVFSCTVYIACKLTIVRRNLPWTDNVVVQKRNRVSAIIVAMICIIFVISEIPHIVTVLLVVMGLPKSTVYEVVRLYEDLFLIVGFSLNFVVYIVTSKHLRQKV